VIYTQRNELLEAADISELIASLRAGTFTDVVRPRAGRIGRRAVGHQVAAVGAGLPNGPSTCRSSRCWSTSQPERRRHPGSGAGRGRRLVQRKIDIVGKESFGGFERNVMLQSVDTHWREHLAALDHLRQGIHLRGYAQKNPKQEYKREAFELFGSMLDHDQERSDSHRDDGAHPVARRSRGGRSGHGGAAGAPGKHQLPARRLQPVGRAGRTAGAGRQCRAARRSRPKTTTPTWV
jgi:preprotein translocase subunit SecA